MMLSLTDALHDLAQYVLVRTKIQGIALGLLHYGIFRDRRFSDGVKTCITQIRLTVLSGPCPAVAPRLHFRSDRSGSRKAGHAGPLLPLPSLQGWDLKCTCGGSSHLNKLCLICTFPPKPRASMIGFFFSFPFCVAFQICGPSAVRDVVAPGGIPWSVSQLSHRLGPRIPARFSEGGGRPPHSRPSFISSTTHLTVGLLTFNLFIVSFFPSWPALSYPALRLLQQ
jgi:hypothetical protein